MRKAFHIVAVSCGMAAGLVGAVRAGEIASEPDGSSVWKAGIDGVEIEWGPDGTLNRIYSRFSQPVAFPDRQGISKAQIIAEEKGKANIVRFISQDVASARVVTEVENDLNQSARSRGTGEADKITKTSQRQMLEALTTVTSSVASGKLRGVIVLERGYDEKEEVAWVKVGISQKTMASSRALEDSLEAQQPAAGAGVPLPGSNVQRLQQKDW